MAITTGTALNDTLKGTAGNDLIQGLDGDDRIVGDQAVELLVDGSFETAGIGAGAWSSFASVGGWKSDTGVEVWGKGFIMPKGASDGDKAMELDFDNRMSKVWQDVPTAAGQQYSFTFDYAMRPGTAAGSNTIEVWWNGAKVGVVDPSTTNWAKATFTVTGTGGTDRIEFREQAGDNDSLGGVIDNVSLKATGLGNDTIAGGFGNDVVDGGVGDDVIYGANLPKAGGSTKPHVVTAADDDQLFGGEGNDTVYGNSGNDLLDGGAGNDSLFGGKGDDKLVGGDGADRLDGNSGDDTLSDGAGNDTVVGGSGSDTFIAGAGDDSYDGGSGFDTISFAAATGGVTVDLAAGTAKGLGNDTVKGVDAVIGSAFADTLIGDGKANVLVGGNGDDVLAGGRGADTLTGGDGADTFVWKVADTKLSSGAPVDVVTDFGAGDVISLEGFGDGLVVSYDGENTHLSRIDKSGSAVDFAVLEGFGHDGITANDMIAAGYLLAV